MGFLVVNEKKKRFLSLRNFINFFVNIVIDKHGCRIIMNLKIGIEPLIEVEIRGKIWILYITKGTVSFVF